MKETLLKVNVVLYTILYNVSLLYVGYRYGRLGSFLWIFIAFYLFMLFAAKSQKNNSVIGTVKNYCIMAIVTLGFAGYVLGAYLKTYLDSGMFPFTEVDIFIFPGILFAGSVLIAVNYFKCAVITRKEDRELSHFHDD